MHRSIRTGDWDPNRQSSSQRSFLPMTTRENVDPLDDINQTLTSENDRPVI
jgi:hypothetical protein